MDAIQVGFLSLLPPIIAISLALITKEVISSLMIGILSGTVIYAVNTGLNPVVGAVDVTFKLMTSRIDMNILLFLALLGALVVVVTRAGGSRAYGKWASSKLRSKKSSLLATSALGALIFIDDYFNCLTVGTVMKPVTDKHGVSRAKLAYIIDATAAPICIIAPISSWAAAVGSNLSITGEFKSDLAAFVATIPYNLYALLSILMLVVLCLADLDFGPMEKVELRAQQQGDLGAVDGAEGGDDAQISSKGRVFDMLIPIGALIVFSILAMLYNGGFWGDDPAIAGNIGAAFGNCVAAEALVLGGFAALVVTFLLFIPRKIISSRDFMGCITEGAKAMIPADVILILAWTISGVCRDLLSTGDYVKTIVEGSALPLAFIPAIIFAIAAFLSFAMGTAWGTFGILIPIIVPVCAGSDLLIVALSATLAGSVFGDHCSPISDTTILSSTGAGCDHIQHVSTQIPYALTVASCCFVGYLVAGFTHANVWLTLGTSVVLLLVAIFVLHRISLNKLRRETAGQS